MAEPTPEEIRELVQAWNDRLGHDEGVWLLRKNGGLSAWYELLATVPNVARAVAAELERGPFPQEVEHLREYLELRDRPAAERRARLDALELGWPMPWEEAVRSCELTDEFRDRFEAWFERAREIERGRAADAGGPFAPGSEVDHATFGRGVVRGRNGDAITVAFERGETRVLARFLRPVV